MVLPIIVGGYLLTRESDRGNTDEIMKQVGFNHPEKFKQIHGGAGTGPLVTSVEGWRRGITEDFDEVGRLLDEANAKAGVAWTGQAAEEHGNSLKPMSQFVQDAKTVSASVGDSAEQQVNNYGLVKNSMPEPVKVDATDNLLEKGGAWLVGGETDLQKQEREATEKAQEAKQHYDNYSNSTTNVSQNLAFYPKAPEMAYDQGSGSTGTNPTVGSIPNGSGIPGGGPGGGGGGGSWGGSLGGGSGSGGTGGTGGPGDGGYTTPSQNTSQWSSPPVTNGPGLPVNPGPNVSTGPNMGGGGIGMMPPGGGAGGAGAGGGRGLGAGGAGGRGAGLGAGGRAGLGGLGGGSGAGAGAGGAAGAAGRGGAGGMGAGAAGRGQGKQGEEDQEHEDKYWVDTDEAWDDLGLPKVAPPVFGE